MAVVLHFPDRFAVGFSETGRTARLDRSLAPACEIVILPCIRRESLERTMPISVEMPAQLQA